MSHTTSTTCARSKTCSLCVMNLRFVETVTRGKVAAEPHFFHRVGTCVADCEDQSYD